MQKTLLYKIIISSRPNTWLRIWGEMIIGAALASYPQFNFGKFLLAFIAASPLLWSAAYMLNDYTDINLDKMHPLRRNRPIANSGIDKPKVRTIIVIFFLASLLLGLSVNLKVFILLLCLFISQVLYTVKPVRLKERKFFDIAINSTNSALRFILGWFSQSIIHHFYIAPMLFFVLIKTVFFIGHRMQNKELEEQNHIKSTVGVLTMSQLKILVMLLTAGSGVLYCYSVYQRIFPVSSILGIILSGIIMMVFFIRKKMQILVSVEENLDLRNVLYFAYFVFANFLAFTIITGL